MVDKIVIARAVVEQALEDICGAKLCEINSMSSRHEMLRLMEKSASALRAALEQPQGEQEPVAFKYEYYDGWTTQLRFDGSKPLQVIPLYTHPQNLNCKSNQARLATLWGYEKPQPPRQPLTEEKVHAAFAAARKNGMHLSPVEAARAIEAAHGIKEQK